jgi:3-oxoacyl-[acyl-carrier-protein] synthase-1
MSRAPRPVFTGMGAVCGAGGSVDEIWDALVNGRSAIGLLQQWDATRWPQRVAAEVTLSDKTLVPDRKLHKLISRTDLFGIYAADQAVRHSGIPACREKLDAADLAAFNDRTGIVVGSGGGNVRGNYDFLPLLAVANGDMKVFGSELPATVNPIFLLKNLPNNVLCHTGILHQFKGTNACITNHSVGGALAVVEAAASLLAGEADRMMVVGHDSPLEPEAQLHFHHLGLLCSDTVRPFDRSRGGTALGEGSAALMLETTASAGQRGATVFGGYLGSGCVSEATGVLAVRPDGDGLSRAIRLALADADIAPDDIGMIVAHGNGGHSSDVSEVTGIRRVFGDQIPPVTAFKWLYGHTIAASGALDLIMTLTALRQQIVPGIATLQTLDAELAPFPASSAPQKPRSDIALILSRGFGGMNVALLVRASS